MDMFHSACMTIDENVWPCMSMLTQVRLKIIDNIQSPEWCPTLDDHARSYTNIDKHKLCIGITNKICQRENSTKCIHMYISMLVEQKENIAESVFYQLIPIHNFLCRSIQMAGLAKRKIYHLITQRSWAQFRYRESLFCLAWIFKYDHAWSWMGLYKWTSIAIHRPF